MISKTYYRYIWLLNVLLSGRKTRMVVIVILCALSMNTERE